MTRFSIGEQVTIRYGRQQGQKGKIIKSQSADVYQVKVEDGSVLFFSGKGLKRKSNDANGSFSTAGRQPLATVGLSGTGADDPSGEGAPRNPLNIETFSHHGIQTSQTPIPFREG